MVWNVLKTILFVLGLWFVFLLAIPIGISIIEVELGVQRIPPQTRTALIAFPIFSMIALWSALTLAIAGHGTPLAVDEPTQLVTRGPYAIMRNPMVFATLGQGAAVGLMLGSVPVLIYVAIMGLFWYFVIKPHEERVLEKRFGDEWQRYRNTVRALIPRFRR